MEQQKDRALALAQAAYESLREADGAQRFGAMLREVNAETVAQALGVCLTTPPFSGDGRVRDKLQTYLQIILTREQIAAQRRMGHTITVLNVVLVLLTLALVWFSWVGYRKDVTGYETRSRPAVVSEQAREPAVSSAPGPHQGR